MTDETTLREMLHDENSSWILYLSKVRPTLNLLELAALYGYKFCIKDSPDITSFLVVRTKTGRRVTSKKYTSTNIPQFFKDHAQTLPLSEIYQQSALIRCPEVLEELEMFGENLRGITYIGSEGSYDFQLPDGRIMHPKDTGFLDVPNRLAGLYSMFQDRLDPLYNIIEKFQWYQPPHVAAISKIQIFHILMWCNLPSDVKDVLQH